MPQVFLLQRLIYYYVLIQMLLCSGLDTSIMTLKPADEDYERAFVEQYKREYGFVVEVC
jgi:hypothetical protein